MKIQIFDAVFGSVVLDVFKKRESLIRLEPPTQHPNGILHVQFALLIQHCACATIIVQRIFTI